MGAKAPIFFELINNIYYYNINIYMNSSKSGFTLLELMIIIIILGVLAALVSGNFITSLKKGRDARRKTDLNQVQKALEMFYEDKKMYPDPDGFSGSTSKFCETSACAASEKVYMFRIPIDPSSGTYTFTIDASRQSYRLYACLENTEQILPYVDLSDEPGGGWCTRTCYNSNNDSRRCIWVLTDSNTTY